MCTNSAVINTIECYMEDLRECFEAYVQKTLLVITIAAGALVAMATYFVKSMQGRNRSITGVGAETQIEQILGTEKSLQEISSIADIKTDKGVIRKESYTKTTSTVHTDEKLCPKKSTSCSAKKLPKCPNCLTKVCERVSPSCSRKSSCESLKSTGSIACIESALSTCSKRSSGSAKASNLSSAICSLLPLCPSNASCKRTCKPPTRRACSPIPCAKSCKPIPTCQSRPCSRTCGKLGRSTTPSLVTYNPPKYKVVPTCCSNSNKTCHIPKACPSKSCTRVVKKKSCYSTCCDDKKID